MFFFLIGTLNDPATQNQDSTEQVFAAGTARNVAVPSTSHANASDIMSLFGATVDINDGVTYGLSTEMRRKEPLEAAKVMFPAVVIRHPHIYSGKLIYITQNARTFRVVSYRFV